MNEPILPSTGYVIPVVSVFESTKLKTGKLVREASRTATRLSFGFKRIRSFCARRSRVPTPPACWCPRHAHCVRDADSARPITADRRPPKGVLAKDSLVFTAAVDKNATKILGPRGFVKTRRSAGVPILPPPRGADFLGVANWSVRRLHRYWVPKARLASARSSPFGAALASRAFSLGGLLLLYHERWSPGLQLKLNSTSYSRGKGSRLQTRTSCIYLPPGMNIPQRLLKCRGRAKRRRASIRALAKNW